MRSSSVGGGPPTSAGARRELLKLALLSALGVVLFVVTRNFAAGNHAIRQQDAGSWYRIGQEAVSAASPESAVEAFRQAVALDRARATYRLALADALVNAGRASEAVVALTALRQQDPESAEVNLRLARLAAQDGEPAEAVRHYQSALASLWPEAESPRRRQLRVELIEFMLNHNWNDRALAELLILDADLPDAASERIKVARLFLAAGAPTQAAERFDDVLAGSPKDPEALAGAGEAAFALGDYARALRFFTALPADTPRVAEARLVARLVLERDPLAPRLGQATRNRRLAATAADILEQLDACSAHAGGDAESRTRLVDLRLSLAALAPTEGQRPSNLKSRDEIEDGLLLLLDSVSALRRASCGPPTAISQAIERIAARHGLSES